MRPAEAAETDARGGGDEVRADGGAEVRAEGGAERRAAAGRGGGTERRPFERGMPDEDGAGGGTDRGAADEERGGVGGALDMFIGGAAMVARAGGGASVASAGGGTLAGSCAGSIGSG